MGCFKMSTGQYGLSRDTPVAPGNPNPRRFTIVQMEQVNQHLVAKIHYPDCDNYEGMKVLVFRNTTALQLHAAPFIDPHFTDQETLKPAARFEPTEEGWQLAMQVAVLMQ